MEETHEYANELGKQGGKNPRKIPKFSINHERFSRTIEKKSKMTPTHSSEGTLMCYKVLVARSKLRDSRESQSWEVRFMKYEV